MATKTQAVPEGAIRPMSDNQAFTIRNHTNELAELGYPGVAEEKLGFRVIKASDPWEAPSVYRKLTDEAGNETFAPLTSVQASSLIRNLRTVLADVRPTATQGPSGPAPVQLYRFNDETGQMEAITS